MSSPQSSVKIHRGRETEYLPRLKRKRSGRESGSDGPRGCHGFRDTGSSSRKTIRLQPLRTQVSLLRPKTDRFPLILLLPNLSSNEVQFDMAVFPPKSFRALVKKSPPVEHPCARMVTKRKIGTGLEIESEETGTGLGIETEIERETEIEVEIERRREIERRKEIERRREIERENLGCTEA